MDCTVSVQGWAEEVCPYKKTAINGLTILSYRTRNGGIQINDNTPRVETCLADMRPTACRDPSGTRLPFPYCDTICFFKLLLFMPHIAKFTSHYKPIKP